MIIMIILCHCGKRNVIGVAIVRSKSSPSSVVQSTDYRQPSLPMYWVLPFCPCMHDICTMMVKVYLSFNNNISGNNKKLYTNVNAIVCSL